MFHFLPLEHINWVHQKFKTWMILGEIKYQNRLPVDVAVIKLKEIICKCL